VPRLDFGGFVSPGLKQPGLTLAHLWDRPAVNVTSDLL